jgi:hypothetical protein
MELPSLLPHITTSVAHARIDGSAWLYTLVHALAGQAVFHSVAHRPAEVRAGKPLYPAGQDPVARRCACLDRPLLRAECIDNLIARMELICAERERKAEELL